MKTKPGIYKHYKGELYRVMGVAKHEETHEELVMYEALYPNPVSKYFVRPLAVFQEKVKVKGKFQPRFTLIKAQPDNRPKVGVGVMVLKKGKVLLGKRKNAHGGGEYANTGGHVEHLESLFDTARRETFEESGIHIKNIRFLCVSNITEYAPKHYIDIGLIAEWKSGEPKVREPEKVESWGWYDLNNLPKPLFAPSAKYIEAYKTGRNFWDQ